MSTLKPIEKTRLEDLLGMADGYVLKFSNRSFAQLFQDVAGIDIYSERYSAKGDSKANRLRAFWDIEDDDVVATVLSEMLEHWAYLRPNPDEPAMEQLEYCKQIINRLRGITSAPEQEEKEFLHREFETVSFSKLPLEPSMNSILEARYLEAERCLQAGSPLAAIFMAGSILEGLLLGYASLDPETFNRASKSPKDHKTGKIKTFPEWRLAEFIDVACECKYLTPDVQKFSHALRDFRNYIHPHQQLLSQFHPTERTAEICLQVLRAAIDCLATEEER